MVVPLLNIPFISVVLLILAGILIGHLIWYRDRSDDEARLSGLRCENNELQAALHEHKQAYLALEADLEDRRKEWEQLRSVNKQLEIAHQTTDQERIELNNEIARLQQLKDQAFHDLDQERQQRRVLQESLANMEENGRNESERVDSLTRQLQAQVASFQAERDEIDEITTARIVEREKREAELKAEIEAVILDKQSLQRELADVQQTVAQMSSELTARERHNSELLQECQRLENEREGRQIDDTNKNTLRAALDRAELDLHEAQESLARLQIDYRSREQDIASLRIERDEFAAQLDDERLVREKIELQLDKVDQLVMQRDTARSEANALEEKVEQLRSQLQISLTAAAENDQLEQQLNALQREYDAVSTMLVDERSRFSKLEADNHRLSLALSESTQDVETATEDFKQQLASQTVELATLRSRLEETAAQLGRERHQREHLQTALHDTRAEAERLAQQCQTLEESTSALVAQNDQLKTQASELQALRGEHASVKKMLSDTTVRLSEIVKSDALASEERGRLETRIDELNQQNANLTQQIARLSAEREERLVELDQVREAEAKSLRNRAEFESIIDQMREENRALQDRLLATGELQKSVRDQQERLQKVVAQRDEAVQANTDLMQDVAELRQQVETQSRSLSALNQQNDQLRSQATEADLLRRANSKLETELKAEAARGQEVAVERDDLAARVRGMENRIAQLEARARANESTIRNLRRERAAVLGRGRQATSVSFVNRSVPEDSGGRMRRDDVLGMVYTQPPKRKDDLKRISGIAQVLEKKLNAFGVYTYRQIMEWDSVAVAEFSKLLSFRDRIERDDWIGQARNLHFETYGRAA